MKTTDLTKPVSSTQLNENMYKKFGVKVNFENYSREELENYRNLLRTKIHQHEAKSNFNDLLTNETYQKDKALVGLLNQKIKEMLGESKKAKKDYDGDGKVESPKDEVWGSRAKAAKKAGKPFEESAKPDFIDLDKDGNKEEPMKKAAKDKKVKEGFPTVDDAKKASAGTAGMKKGESKKSSTGGTITKTATGIVHKAGKNYGGQDAPKTPDSDKKSKKVKESSKNLPGNQEKIDVDHDGKIEKSDLAKLRAGKKKKMKESTFKQNVRIVNESLRQLIAEDEEGKAKTITSGADMVNDFTSWMTRVGQFQTKAMIELADNIRANFGQAEAEQFKSAVAPALEQALNTLTQCREEISNAVAVLAGESSAMEPMGSGMDDMGGMAGGEEIPDAGMDSMNTGDEFGASDAAAGGPEISGRTRRESREVFARKLSEAHSIVSKLAK